MLDDPNHKPWFANLLISELPMDHFVLFGTTEAGLHYIDWIILVLYAAATIGMGWFVGRQQKSTKEYFIGSGNMNPILIGVSMFATLLSTISYLSGPGEIIGKGPIQASYLLGLPISYLVIGYGIVPVLKRNRVTSAYELLEERLGLAVRLLGASLFVLLRLMWMSVLTYVAAEAMAHMMGVDEQYIPWIVFVTGSVAVVYTSLGGIRAVVITDAVQTALLFGGAWLVIIMVSFDLGGFSWIPTKWHDNWDTQPFFPADLKTRSSALGAIVMVVTWSVCTHGGDQTAIQRYMATSNVYAARRSLFTLLTTTAVVTITLYLVGLCLLTFFEKHPNSLAMENLPHPLELKADADKMFPHFIAFHLPVGLSGLVIAAMFAAAMSSLDSGVNSITAVVSTDFLGRFGIELTTERGRIIFTRVLALAIGAIVLGGSSFVGVVPGNIFAVTNKTVNLLLTPIFGLFFFGVFVRFACPLGAIAGAIVGLIVASMIAFSGPLVAWLGNHYGLDPTIFGVEWVNVIDTESGEFHRTVNQDPISFQWISPIALTANLGVGTLVSLLMRTRSRS